MNTVYLNSEECKGCGLCVEACPPKVLRLAEGLNRYGYHPAEYAGKGCTACGICYFVCPEPGGIQVLRGIAGDLVAGARIPVSQSAGGNPPCLCN